MGGDGFGGGVLGGGLIVAEVDQGEGVGQGDGHVLPAADLAALLLDLGRGAVLLDFAGDAVGGGGGHFKVGVGLLAVLGGGEGEDQLVLLDGDAVFLPDAAAVVVPDALGGQGVGQGLVAALFLGAQSLGGDPGDIAPAEGRGGGGIDLVRDAQLIGEGPGGIPGEVRGGIVAQGPEDQGQVFRGGEGLAGGEGRLAGAVGQALFVGIADIGLGPFGDIGEGGGPRALQSGLLLAQQTHQHGHALGAGGGVGEGEDGEALFVGVGALEEAHVIEGPGGVFLVGVGGGGRQSGEGQAQAQDQSEEKGQCFFHGGSPCCCARVRTHLSVPRGS